MERLTTLCIVTTIVRAWLIKAAGTPHINPYGKNQLQYNVHFNLFAMVLLSPKVSSAAHLSYFSYRNWQKQTLHLLSTPLAILVYTSILHHSHLHHSTVLFYHSAYHNHLIEIQFYQHTTISSNVLYHKSSFSHRFLIFSHSPLVIGPNLSGPFLCWAFFEARSNWFSIVDVRLV